MRYGQHIHNAGFIGHSIGRGANWRHEVGHDDGTGKILARIRQHAFEHVTIA